MTEQIDFNAVIKQAVDQAVVAHITPLILGTLDSLTADADWIEKVERRAQQHVGERVAGKIRNIDLDSLLREQIDAALERWRGRLLENFSSPGITDSASRTQLVIQDQAVVVNTTLAAPDLVVEKEVIVGESLRVKNLAVTGDINTDNRAWQRLAGVISEQVYRQLDDQWRESLTQQILDRAREQGIDFSHVMIDGTVMIEKDRLAESIKTSALKQLGTLDQLTVSGVVSMTNTVQITPRRVGINTDDPEMALSVWDEEVSVLVGKHARDGAYIGTGRRQRLGLGVDRKIQLTIEEDGTVAIKKDLRIDRFRLGFVDSTPGFSGTRGDFLLNSDPRPDQPFAWVCLGGFRWQALKAAS